MPKVGLGRYGEDFYLNADLDTLSQYECMLNLNGLLFLTLSISKIGQSYIDYNTRRLYDLKSLHFLLENWITIDRCIYNFGSNIVVVLRKGNQWAVYFLFGRISLEIHIKSVIPLKCKKLE